MALSIIKEPSELRSITDRLRKEGSVIGFVPTMGALHEGHLSLVRTALTHGTIPLVSIFVNPTQFNDVKDLENYPRQLDKDKILLQKEGVTFLFAPESNSMYDGDCLTKLSFGPLEEVMEGKFRPGHFSGVATIVAKLFHLVGECKAFFGQKDYQQFAIIQQMVKDLDFPVELVRCPTVREENGLAMSSRNERLSKSDRERASLIYRLLVQCYKEIISGSPVEQVLQIARSTFQSEQWELDYLQLVDAVTLQPVKKYSSEKELVLCFAGYISGVRLIDNWHFTTKS